MSREHSPRGRAVRRLLGLLTIGAKLTAWILIAVVVASVVLTLVIRTPGEAARDFDRLHASGQRTSRIATNDRFRELYAERLGPNPAASAIKAAFESDLEAEGWFTLDSIMADYIVANFGEIDARTLPPGVYVGLRAIGPDEPPLVKGTQYLYHFGFFVRHGYALVVHEGRPARLYSAGLEGDFVPSTSEPKELYAEGQTYTPGAYDFPRQGQAIHELIAITRDAEEIDIVEARIRVLEQEIRRADLDYRLILRNSNTVVGCLLAAAGASVDRVADSSTRSLVRLRLAGIGFPLGVLDDRRAPDRCAKA